MRQRRAQLRERRQKTAVPTVALVGYTNAGKTTLFNRLTRPMRAASDALFVTLDPLVRRVRLPDGASCCCPTPSASSIACRTRWSRRFARRSRRRPRRPAAARRWTPPHPSANATWPPSLRVLEEVGATEVPRIDVYNKVDRLLPDERRRIAEADPSAVQSAATGEGCDELLDLIAARLSMDQQRVSLELDLNVDADRQQLVWLYRHARVHSQVTQGDRAMLDVECHGGCSIVSVPLACGERPELVHSVMVLEVGVRDGRFRGAVALAIGAAGVGGCPPGRWPPTTTPGLRLSRPFRKAPTDPGDADRARLALPASRQRPRGGA